MRRSILTTLSRLTATTMLLQALAPAALALQTKPKMAKPSVAPMVLPPAVLVGAKPRVVKPGPDDLRPLPPGTRVQRAVPSPTILDERGYLRGSYSNRDALAWRQELWSHPAPAREARLRVLLGEYEIGNGEPVRGQEQLRRAIARVPASNPDRGLASYDAALTLFFQGRFPEARHEFRRILRAPLRGFGRKNASLYAKHASACASYHAAHAALGIPQPSRLDPLCGAASLASAMRALGMRHDRAEVLSKVKHNGEGSSLQDLQDALPSLGLSGSLVTADQKGLIASPVPLVAYVERDHFVTVVSADRRGIEYVCSDCGAWPGGPVRLTWKQWKAMDASLFLAISKPGSPEALAMAHLPSELGGKPSRIDIAKRGASGLAAVVSAQRAIAAMAGHVAVIQTGNPYGHTQYVFCGMRGTSLHCTFQHCPLFTPSCHNPYASFEGEPVNLATGEEEYTPAPDLTVYNPKGPSIVWSRTYNSLANTSPSGFGSGWSHSYNYRIVRKSSGSTTLTELVLPNAARLTINDAGKPAPTAAAPVTPLSFGPGVPMKVEWRYSSGAGYSYVVTFKDQTKWHFTNIVGNSPIFSYPTKIEDRFGNALTLSWTSGTLNQPDPETNSTTGLLLYGISNADGELLRINLTTNGRIDYVLEYPSAAGPGRAIRYKVEQCGSGTAGTDFPQDELTQVSFLRDVTGTRQSFTISGTVSPANERYAYTYANYSNLEGAERVPYLRNISVPASSGISTTAPGTWNLTSRSTTTLDYGNDGSVTRVTDGQGNYTTFTPVLDTSGNAIKTTVVTKDAGGKASLQYSAAFNSQMSSVQRMSSVGNDYPVAGGTFTPTVSAYADPNDPYEPSSVTDGNGRTWHMAWDRYGNLKASDTPKGIPTFRNYDATFFGQLTYEETSGLTATSLYYDAATGVPTAVDSPVPYRSGAPALQTTTYGAFTALGNPTSVTVPGNQTTSFRATTLTYADDPGFPYERLGLPTKVTDSASHSETMRYDLRGNLVQQTDRDGNQTDYVYDRANQVVQVTLPATGQNGANRAYATYTYAYLGGPVTLVQQYGETGTLVAKTATQYTVEGAVLTQVGTGEYQAYSYDASYRPTTVYTGTPGNFLGSSPGTGTRFDYDAAGRVIRERGPNATGNTGPNTKNYTYDPAGNLLTETDGRGWVKTYAYGTNDADGMLTRVSYTAANGTPLTAANNEGYDRILQYDAFDRPIYVVGGNGGTVRFAYDDLGNVKQERRLYAREVVFDYQYNPDGSARTMDLSSTNSANVPYNCHWAYAYDSVGRFTSQLSPMGVSSVTLTDGGELKSRTLPNGATTTYSRFLGTAAAPRGAMYAMTNASPSGGTNSYYAFDFTPLQQLNYLSNSVNNAAPGFAGGTQYTYSAPTGNNALVLTGEGSGRNGGYSQTHSYDTGLNPLTLRGSTAYQAGGSPAYRPDDVPTAGAASYDAVGNYSANGFLHDAENRLYAGPNGFSAGYRPDDGLRAWKTVNGSRVFKFYDQGGDPVLETDAVGNQTLIQVSDPAGLVGTVDPTNGAQAQYQFDPQGSVAHRLDRYGNVVDSRMYDAYGGEWFRDASNVPFAATLATDRFGFDARWGYVTDRDIGMCYCRSRNYAPGWGRWLERDPIGFEGGMNPYAYCADQPVGRMDPSGLIVPPVPPPLPLLPFAGAAAAGFGLGLLINQIPAVQAAQRAAGEALARLIGGGGGSLPPVPRRRSRGRPIYRAVEEDESYCLGLTGGTLTPSPKGADPKQFFLTREQTQAYINRSRNFGHRDIWMWPNPNEVGYPSGDVDGIPGGSWSVPTWQLPLVGPGYPVH